MSETPVTVKLTKWEEWRGIVIFLVVLLASSIVLWHIPALQPAAPLILLGIGLFFDGISVAARISTAITGRYSSGFFLVGFAFYVWAWLSYPHPVLLSESHGLLALWIRKSLDLLCMAVLHMLCHTSFAKAPDNKEDKEAEQSASHVRETRGGSRAGEP